MNKDDKKISKILNKDIKIPESYFDTINYTFTQLPEKNKKKFKINKYKFTLATTCCSLILITGVVFAKDIGNYVKHLFTFSTKAIDNAVENGFVQSVNEDFVYDNNIGIKVNNLILDDQNLAISFCYETQKENINSIWLDRFTVSTGNGDLIYEYEKAEEAKVGLAQSMERAEQPTKITDTTFLDSILFGLRQKETEFDNLHFEIRSVRLERTDHTIESLEGNWKFNVAISDAMKKSESYHYNMVGNNEYVKSCTGILSATGMTIEIVPVTPISTIEDYEKMFEKVDIKSFNYFSLKNENEMFNVSQSNFDANLFTLKYNTVGKFFKNIDEFELYLTPYNSIITLKKD